MKKRKIVAMALSVMMAVSAIPAVASAAAVTPRVIQPYSIPEVGNQFYVEGVSAPAETDLKSLSNNMVTTAPAGSAKNANWYNAAGVIFGIKPTNGDDWFRPESANSGKDPYLFFSVLALTEQKVTAYSSTAATNYATFWTSDYFCGNKGRSDTQNPRVSEETGMMYYSEDNGLTWKSIQTYAGDGIYHFDLSDVRKGEVLIYIPMEEFFYYGGYNGATGTTLPSAYGVSANKKGYTTFGHGVEILKNNNSAEGMNLHSLILSCHKANSISSGPVGAASAVTATDLRLVYNVTEETKTVKNGDAYSMELYANEPAGVTDAVVKAKIGEREETLSGTVTGEGRTKYVLNGLTAENVGDLVTFTWSSESLDVEMIARDKVMRADPLQTLPSQLTLSTGNYSSSPLWGGNAVYAGDSLMYAARDKAADGWPGRIAKTYSMTYKNYGIGGHQISNFVGRGNAPFICNQINKEISAKTVKEREAVEYVILDGGVNDINRDGVQMGAMTSDFDGFDVRTYAGALEYTFSVARRAYPNATVGFIILFQMPEAIQGGSAAKCQNMTTMRAYIDLTIAICEKWGVPYLNMFDDQAFNDLIDTDNTNTKYMDRGDMLHLNKDGYILTMPYVAAWMASMERKYIPYDQILDGVSVTLTNGAAVNVWAKDIAEATDAKMTVSVAGGTPKSISGINEDGRIKYTYNVDPHMLGDELTFTWSSENWGDSETATVSVRDYCKYLITASGDSKLVSLAKALLKYGAEQQKAKNYKTDALCNAGVGAPSSVKWPNAAVSYSNPNEAVFTGVELITDPTPTLKLKITAPNPGITSVAYRVDRSRAYGRGEYEIAEIVDGTVEIPLGIQELGRVVMIRMLDNTGAWKENLKITGLHCLKDAGSPDSLTQAYIQYAVCLANYVK